MTTTVPTDTTPVNDADLLAELEAAPAATPADAATPTTAASTTLIPRDNFGQRARDISLAPVRGQEPTWNLLAHAATLAGMIAHTRFVPAGFRGKPDSITAAFLLGHELGVGPMTSLRQLYITDVKIGNDGKERGGEILVASQLMRAVARRAGHRLWPEEYSSTRVTWAGHSRRDEEHVIHVTWTVEDAKRAKLVRPYSAWETFPRAMLSARASAELCRVIAEDVLSGVYAVEEMQDDPDLIRGLQERVIDAADVTADEPAPAQPDSATRKRSTRRAVTATVTTSQPVPPASATGHEQDPPGPDAATPGIRVPGDEEPAEPTPPAEAQHAAPPTAAAPEPAASDLEVPGDTAPVEPPGAPAPARAAEAMPLAQKIAMVAREAAVDRTVVCKIVSGGRVESAKDLSDEEAMQALQHLRAIIRGDERIGFANVDGAPTAAFVPVTEADLNELTKTELAKLSGTQGALRRIVGAAGWSEDKGPLLLWVATLSRQTRVELIHAARDAQKPPPTEETA